MTMTTPPAAGVISGASNQGILKQALEDTLQAEKELPGGAAKSTVTIAAGTLVVSQAAHDVDTEAAASTDDLTAISVTGIPSGRIVTLSCANAGRATIVRSGIAGSGRIILADGQDYALDNTSKKLTLRLDGADWVEIGRANVADNPDLALLSLGNFAPSQQILPNMTVAIAAGSILSGTALTKVAAQNTTTITAPVTNPRWDIVYIDQTTGVVGVATGTESASPSDPAVPSGKIPVARVRLTAAAVTIPSSIIDDIRQIGASSSSGVSIISSVRNLKMSQTSASASFTITADEIIVETALGGTVYRLASFNKTVNLAATGAGGMDTGSAPASGFISVYAAVKADGTTTAFACSTATSSGSVYSGANLPSGYIATALIAVLPTNGSSQVPISYLRDRTFWHGTRVLLVSGNSGLPTTFTSLSVSSAIPSNAVSMHGILGNPAGATTNPFCALAADATGTGEVQASNNASTATGVTFDNFAAAMPFFGLPIITAQTIYYKALGATVAIRAECSGYTF
ncbi:MAG TPA: hypothetical protein VND94_01055 [Terriglobia bacterium]|nr:hypothetical protein [Terriglobia bacterium]